MARWILSGVLACVLVASTGLRAQAATFTMVWDNTLTTSGFVSYDGAGGAMVGTNIQLWDLFTFDDSTTAGTDESFTCVNCVLNFTTGANLAENGGVLYLFDGGGTFTLTGTLFDGATQINTSSNVLLSGTFVANPLFGASFTSSGAGSYTVNGFGTDFKNQELLDYLGILAATWNFTGTNITTSPCTPTAVTFAFNCSVYEGDITNVATDGVRDNPVPEPGSMMLLGSGLLGLAGAVRRRMARK